MTQPVRIDLMQLVNAIFLLAVFAVLIRRFTRTRSHEEQYASEFAAARSVQQYLIPEQLPNTPGLAIESEYRPAREVGGDFFQVLPQAADGSVLIVVGDVAGHGLEAGMLATLIVGALPLGAVPGIDFPVLHFELVEGDSLMLMTDGVAEAQNAEDHLFGFDRITELLQKGMAGAALASAAQTFGQQDDVTVLTAARLASAASA